MSKSEKNDLEKFFDEPSNEIPLGGGLSAEEMIATFFDSDALIHQPEKVFRLNGGKDRYYYTFDPDGEPFFYTSVTTMIKQTMPTSPHLVKWIAEMGYEEALNYTEERADYGTFMHTEIAILLIEKKLDLDLMDGRLKKYIEANGLASDFIYYLDDMKRDLLAFGQFMIDYDVKPHAIEIILTNKEDGYAGAIDLVCSMTIEEKGFHGEVYKSGVNKGRPKETKELKRIRAIIDFKSGRKGFYESHEIQLECYRQMWNTHYPEIGVTRMFNWSPKAWTGATPTYNLKDQTDSKNLSKLPHLVQLAKLERKKKSNQITVLEGVIDLAKRDLSENFYTIEISEIVKQKNNERKNS